ncbi:MAG: hypothetical protein U1F16_02120 [Turneriella sp.]
MGSTTSPVHRQWHLSSFCRRWLWSAGNIILKTFKIQDFGGFIAWTSLLSSLPLTVLAFTVDGAEAMLQQVQHASLRSLACVGVYVAVCHLFGVHPVQQDDAQITCEQGDAFATLVPIFGLGSTALVLGERSPYSSRLAPFL